jgi:hypothetical protein
MHHLTKIIKELNSKNLLKRIGRYVMSRTPIEVADLAFVFGTRDKGKSLPAKSGSAPKVLFDDGWKNVVSHPLPLLYIIY